MDAQGQRAVKLETREEDGDGGKRGARGTIVVTGGQLEQIWESRNLSLRKDDPALSSALCVRLPFDRLLQNMEPVEWKFLNFSNPGDVKGLE